MIALQQFQCALVGLDGNRIPLTVDRLSAEALVEFDPATQAIRRRLEGVVLARDRGHAGIAIDDDCIATNFFGD